MTFPVMSAAQQSWTCLLPLHITPLIELIILYPCLHQCMEIISAATFLFIALAMHAESSSFEQVEGQTERTLIIIMNQVLQNNLGLYIN